MRMRALGVLVATVIQLGGSGIGVGNCCGGSGVGLGHCRDGKAACPALAHGAGSGGGHQCLATRQPG